MMEDAALLNADAGRLERGVGPHRVEARKPRTSTRERAATDSQRRSAVYTRIYTGLAALLLASLAACGGGGDEEADGEQRKPPVNCQERREACV